MILRPPISTRTDTLFPYTTLFRSIRNDLSRIAAPGSVKTPSLFDIETYPTLHQLTSTVTARLDEGRTAVDVLAAMFPCGSVTGAPKIRAMEVIAATEQEARGVYTGSIGWRGPEDRQSTRLNSSH